MTEGRSDRRYKMTQSRELQKRMTEGNKMTESKKITEGRITEGRKE
jgi:hypothetical protein